MRASVLSGGRSLSQYSQLGRSESAIQSPSLVTFKAFEGFHARFAAPLRLAWSRAEPAHFLRLDRTALRTFDRRRGLGWGDSVSLEALAAARADPVGGPGREQD